MKFKNLIKTINLKIFSFFSYRRFKKEISKNFVKEHSKKPNLTRGIKKINPVETNRPPTPHTIKSPFINKLFIYLKSPGITKLLTSRIAIFFYLVFNLTIIIFAYNLIFVREKEKINTEAAILNRYISTTGSNGNTGTTSGSAWGTLQYAVDQDYQSILSNGDVVEICIANGTYIQSLNINQSGLEILPVTANVSITNGNRLTFPSGTNLSSVVVGDYLYVYRSWVSNNGYFRITAVNDSSDWVEVAGGSFPLDESGSSGDFNALSASIGRPIILRNCEGGSVVLELDNYSCQGISITQEEYVIIKGIEIRNSTRIVTGASPTPTLPAGFQCGYDSGGSGIGIYESNHIVLDEMNIHSNDRVGIKMGEIYTTQAGGAPGVPGSTYNFIMNSTFYDFGLSGSSPEAIYMGEDTLDCNTNVDEGNNYNHFIGNEFTSTGSIEQENAIDIKGDCNGNINRGTVIERNYFYDFRGGPSGGNGVIMVNPGARHNLIYRNEFENIKTGPNCQPNNCYTSAIDINTGVTDTFVYNNLIHGATPHNAADRIYGISIDGGGTPAVSGNNVVVINNTIHDTGRAMYLQNSSTPANTAPGVVRNNVFSSPQFTTYPYFVVENDTTWIFSDNAYTSNPASSIIYGYPTSNIDSTYTPNIEVGGIINANLGMTDPANGDFTISSGSVLRDAGYDVSSFINRDYLLNIRPENGAFDIGAYEFQAAPTPTPSPTPTPVSIAEGQALSQAGDYILSTDFSSLGFETNDSFANSDQNDFQLNSFIESFDTAQTSATGFKFKSGLQATWEVDVATISTLSNTDNGVTLYDRLLYEINPASNPTTADGARFAVQVSTNNFSTFKYLNTNTYQLDNIPNPDLSIYYKPCAQTLDQPSDDNRHDCGNVSNLKRYITGLIPDTNYQVRVVSMNGSLTNSEPGPQTTQSTGAFSLILTINNPNIDLGNLSTTSQTFSPTNPSISIETNNLNGYSSYIKGEGNGSGSISSLYSSTNNYQISSISGDLGTSVGSEGYGLNATINQGTNITIDDLYNPTILSRTTNYVGQISRNPTILFSKTGVNSEVVNVVLNIGANIGSQTPAGNDYTDTLTIFVQVNP